MGTRLDFVITPEPATPLREIAAMLTPHILIGLTDVVVHFHIAEYSAVRLLCTEFSDGQDMDVMARQLSLLASRALHEWYSDSLGEAGYAWFERGLERERDAAEGHEKRLYPWFQKGLSKVFPAWAALGPEDALDIIYGSEAGGQSFVLARDGRALSIPDIYVPPVEVSHQPSLLDREFSWGRRPRQLVSGCAWIYGGLVVLGVLAVLAWWGWEILRP